MQHMILGINNVLVDIVVLQIKNSVTETPTKTDSDPYINYFLCTVESV